MIALFSSRFLGIILFDGLGWCRRQEEWPKAWPRLRFAEAIVRLGVRTVLFGDFIVRASHGLGASKGERDAPCAHRASFLLR